MSNQKIYVLKGNVKNPSWELKNRGVLIPKSEKEGMREIQYVPGADSIWKHENEKQGTPKSIWFTDGSHAVSKADKIQIEFIESHPAFNVDFILHDPEAAAEAEFEKFEKIETAKELLRKSSEDEDKMAATAAALFGPMSMTWGAKQTKLKCYKYAEEKPQDVIDAMEDPAAEAHYIAALGLRKGILDTNPQKTAVVWNDKDRGVIVNVPTGQKPLTVLGAFLYGEENLVTLQEIGKRIDEIDGKSKKEKSGKKSGK